MKPEGNKNSTSQLFREQKQTDKEFLLDRNLNNKLSLAKDEKMADISVTDSGTCERCGGGNASSFGK